MIRMKYLFPIVVSASCVLTAFAARSPRYESPKGEKADIWPFCRKPGKGLAESGPLGIVPGRNGKRLTMRILRMRKEDVL